MSTGLEKFPAKIGEGGGEGAGQGCGNTASSLKMLVVEILQPKRRRGAAFNRTETLVRISSPH